MKKTILLWIIAGLMLISAVMADTGTYIIKDQQVDLIIKTDSNVEITYNIVMEVTGGNIPWVTIGLPDSNFDVLETGRATRAARPRNSAGWTGVYVELDKTYYEGETFQFVVTVNQKGLVKKTSENQTSIKFIPLWWDNAIIEKLSVIFHLPPEIKEITTISEATRYDKNIVVWEWNFVPRGAKYTTGMVMPSEAFPGLKDQPVSGDISSDGFKFLGIGIIPFLAIIILFYFIYIKGSKGSYISPSFSLGGDKSVTRKINMDCPNDNNRLEKVTIKGVTIDICRTCGGILFDKGEIENLIKKDVNENEFIKPSIPFKKLLQERTPSGCLRCDESIERINKIVDGKTMSIFKCEDCNSIWMNHGTYQIIKDKRLEQEEKAKGKDDDFYPVAWWIFYGHIGATGNSSGASFGGGESGGGGSSGSYVSSCVSCACVAACACACACAGGGAAGCAPKNKIGAKYNQIKI